MTMMPWRYDELVATVAGYQKTGAQLVGYDGAKVFPSGISDDIGLYYFVPKFVRLFNCSLDQAINFFFYGMVIGACLIGIAGFCALTKSLVSRIFATAYLAAFSYYSCMGMTDTYLVFSSCALAVIPWILYFMKRGKADGKTMIFYGVVGVVAGYAHFIRSYSSGAVILFVLLAVFFMPTTWWRRVLLFVALGAGIMIPLLHMNLLKQTRRQHVDVSYQQFKEEHVLWHNVYAGFGFLRNDFGIESRDELVYAHARLIDPNVVCPSAYYDTVVRGMVFDLIKKHPQFVLQTWFAKFGVILYYLLLFANIGLLLALMYRKQWQIDFMFFVALAFSSIFGFIALPGRFYLLGMLAFAVLYCIVSVDYAVKQWGNKRRG